jgi:hypothetical protein
MDLEGSRPQFSKLRTTTKMTLQDDSSNFSTIKASIYMKNNINIQSRSSSIVEYVEIVYLCDL